MTKILTRQQWWERILKKSWYWLKILAVFVIFSMLSFVYGTFNPNATATQKVNKQLDNYYIDKIKNLDQYYIDKIKGMSLHPPAFEYVNEKQFVRAMYKCIDYINFMTPIEERVPYEMIIGQAVLETGWGESRFAKEGNNLFGIKTWNESMEHMLPMGIDKWPGWGVRVFKSKCGCVKEYIRILNEHPAYKEFRELRTNMLKENKPLDATVLIKTLDKFSTTEDYDKRVIRMIKKIRELEEIHG